MFSWAGNATSPGAFHRIRHQGNPVHLPINVHAASGSMQVVFSDALDPSSITPAAFRFSTWAIQRSADYGSPHLDERSLEITTAGLGADGRTITLGIPSLMPADCYELEMNIREADGRTLHRSLHGTIHHLNGK
jgi:hypothetical protein